MVEIDTGKVRAIETESRTTALDYHPQGNIAVIGLADGTLQKYEMPALKPAGEPLRFNSGIEQLAYSPDGTKLIVSTFRDKTIVLDTVTDRPVGTPFDNSNWFAWGSKDNELVVADEFDFQIWDYPVAVGVRSPLPKAIEDSIPPMAYLDIGPEGRAIWGNQQGTAQMVDLKTGLPIGQPMLHPLPKVAVARFTPDGRYCVTSCHPPDAIQCQVRIWDAKTGEPVSKWLMQRNWVHAITFSPDSKWMATGDYASYVSVWDMSNLSEPRFRIATKDIVKSLAISPDGRRLAAGLTRDWTKQPRAVLFDVQTQEQIGDFMLHDDSVTKVQFSPDGSKLATTSQDGYLKLWDGKTADSLGNPIQFSDASGCAVFSPDGQGLLTGAADGSIRLWEADSGAPVWQAVWTNKDVRVTALAFSNNGDRFVAAYADGQSQLFDTRLKSPIGPTQKGRSVIGAIKFFPDDSHWTSLQSNGQAQSFPVPLSDSLSPEFLSENLHRATGFEFDAQAQSVIPEARPPLFESRERVGLSTLPAGLLPQPESLAASPDAIRQRVLAACEDNQVHAATVWVSRAQSADPENWHWHAVETALLAEQQEYQLADERIRARLESNSAQYTDWLRRQAARTRDGDNWPVARWYQDKLVRLFPDDWQLLRDRAAILDELGETAAGDRDRELALDLDPDSGFLREMAVKKGLQQKWKQAAALYSRIDDAQRTLADREQHAVCAVLADDLDLFNSVCRAALDRCDVRAPTTGEARYTGHICRFGPVEKEQGERAVELIQRLVDKWKPNEKTPKAQDMEILAWLHLRMGNSRQAVETFQQTSELLGRKMDTSLMGLAIAHAQLGEYDKAREVAELLDTDSYIEAQRSPWIRAILRRFAEEIQAALDSGANTDRTGQAAEPADRAEAG